MTQSWLRLVGSLLLIPGLASARAPALRAQADSAGHHPPATVADTTPRLPLYILVTDIGSSTARIGADTQLVSTLLKSGTGQLAARSAPTQVAAESACAAYAGVCHVMLFKEAQEGGGIALELRLLSLADSVPTTVPKPPPHHCDREPTMDESWFGCRKTYFRWYYLTAVLDHNQRFHPKAGGQR